MFHLVGSTPEAPSLEAALGGRSPVETVVVGPAELRAARDQLSTTEESNLGAVSLGTPHYSVAEFARLVDLIGDQRVAAGVNLYVCTGRAILTEIRLRGWEEILESAGARIVTDTCTYMTPIMDEVVGVAMTDSAKWAYYAPGNLGVEVVFGSVEDCVASAVAGSVERDQEMWADG